METITIKVNNAKAIKLLEDLEALDLIEVIKRSVTKEKTKKLSERLAGSISPKDAAAMHKELNKIRE